MVDNVDTVDFDDRFTRESGFLKNREWSRRFDSAPSRTSFSEGGKRAIFPSEIVRVRKAKVKENASFGKEFVMQPHT
jgi:hypothetical protein